MDPLEAALGLFVFARFHAREGQEAALAQAICNRSLHLAGMLGA
jgi:hypothetical protein